MRCFTLIFTADLNSGNSPVVITWMLAGTINQQILLFVDEVLAMKFPHLKIRRKLDGVGRTRLFAITAEDAAGEIDAEEFRIAPPGWILGCLQRDAIHRARHCAKVARHATLAPIR